MRCPVAIGRDRVMRERRGTAKNPFEKGEEVYILGMHRYGVVTEVLPPEKPRAQMRYTVEWNCPFNGEESDTFPSSQLTAAPK